jgi:predicted dehydrogenase
MEPIRWGVVGTGVIAGDFARDLRLLPGHVMAAVGSRTQQRADAFAAEHGIAHRHATYEQLVEDPAVDVVYVATPNPEHGA